METHDDKTGHSLSTVLSATDGTFERLLLGMRANVSFEMVCFGESPPTGRALAHFTSASAAGTLIRALRRQGFGHGSKRDDAIHSNV